MAILEPGDPERVWWTHMRLLCPICTTVFTLDHPDEARTVRATRLQGGGYEVSARARCPLCYSDAAGSWMTP